MDAPKRLNLVCAELIADYDPASQEAFVEICSIEGYAVNKATMNHIIHTCPPPSADRQAVFAAWREARAKAEQRMMVEEEQNGSDRAEYGTYLLWELSARLTAQFGKGYSAENLKLMRHFYSIYANDQIGETVFTQSPNLPAVSTGRKFFLSWSHYLKLMRISNAEERHFYESEVAASQTP